MHLSVLTTSLKLATEPPASQVSACLSTVAVHTAYIRQTMYCPAFPTLRVILKQEGGWLLPCCCFVKESEVYLRMHVFSEAEVDAAVMA